MLTRTVKLHRIQARFRKSSALYRGFVGGIGSGKSFVGAYDLLRRAQKNCLYMVTAPTYPMLKDATLRTFLEQARGLSFLTGLNKSDMTATLGNGAEILFRSTDDPERLRGPNLSGVWMDEASLSHRDAFTVVIGRLREGGERGWLSATFTPKGINHWTYDVWGKQTPDTELFTAGTFQNPFLHPEFYETVKRQYTEMESRQELGGEFIDADEHLQVIPTAWARLAMDRWKPEGKGEQKLSAVGVDVARGGQAKTVIAKRYGYWWAPLSKYPGAQTPDGPTVANLIGIEIRDNPLCLVNIDVIGVGSSAFDACRERRMHHVNGINFGGGTKAQDRAGVLRFANIRAWAYWTMRELLDPANGHDVQLPPDKELLADLTAPKWMAIAGGIKIEKKEEIEKRLGRSVDSGDAVIYSIVVAR